jgi:hypothetical protein
LAVKNAKALIFVLSQESPQKLTTPPKLPRVINKGFEPACWQAGELGFKGSSEKMTSEEKYGINT